MRMAASTRPGSHDRSDNPPTSDSSPERPHSDQAERYRLMAKEVRGAAEEMHDMVSRQTLKRIADDYERLAVRSERRVRGTPISPGSRGHR